MPSDRKFLIGTTLAVIGALGGLAWGMMRQPQQPFWWILSGLGIAYGVYQTIVVVSCYRYACEPKTSFIPLGTIGGRMGSVTGTSDEAAQVRMVIAWGFGEGLAWGMWLIILGFAMQPFRPHPASAINITAFGLLVGIYFCTFGTAGRLEKWRSSIFRLSPNPQLAEAINASRVIVSWSPLGILCYQIPRGCWHFARRLTGAHA